MRSLFIIACLSLLVGCKQSAGPNLSALRDGDLIFQTSTSPQSQAIQVATKSKYSHCGIIYKKEDNDFYVYEAIQPVQYTPLKKWILRGENGHYVVKRLKDADKLLTQPKLLTMKKIGQRYYNKNYDLYFEWNDERMYCSEVIWKIYKRGAGIEIAKLQKLKDFDLTNPIVQAKLKERYGNAVPENEKVISPAAIFDSNLLYTVFEN